MKKNIIFILLVMLNISNSYSQVWEQLPNTSGVIIPSHSISFPSPDIGYGGYSVVSENTQLNKTYIFRADVGVPKNLHE
jgi:hypothetical protein